MHRDLGELVVKSNHGLKSVYTISLQVRAHKLLLDRVFKHKVHGTDELSFSGFFLASVRGHLSETIECKLSDRATDSHDPILHPF